MLFERADHATEIVPADDAGQAIARLDESDTCRGRVHALYRRTVVANHPLWSVHEAGLAIPDLIQVLARHNQVARPLFLWPDSDLGAAPHPTEESRP